MICFHKIKIFENKQHYSSTGEMIRGVLTLKDAICQNFRAQIDCSQSLKSTHENRQTTIKALTSEHEFASKK